MRMRLIIALKVFVFISISAQSNFLFANKKLTEDYVSNFKASAISEMKRTGIPASIKLAQGMLESNLGRSDLAYRANNHFGIKCGNNWTGEVYYKLDDDIDSTGNIMESCFRSYASAFESYVAHSDFLTNPAKSSRYGFLFTLGTTDYEGWANGLRFSGYATDPTYANKLIKIIESNQLYKYDEPIMTPKNNASEPILVSNEVKENPKSTNSKVDVKNTDVKKTTPKTSSNTKYKSSKINDLKAVYANGGETVKDLSNRMGKDVFEILEYNEGITSQDEIFDDGEIVFLEKKKRAYHDDQTAFHIVSSDETMYEISQMYGIRLESLLAKNNLTHDAVPNKGAKISLIKNLSKKETPSFRYVERFDSYVDLGGLK